MLLGLMYVEHFYSGLKDIFVAAVGACIQELSEDSDGIQVHAERNLVQTGRGEKAAMLKLCAHASLQQLTFGFANADRSPAEMASFIGEVTTAQVGTPTWISIQSANHLGVLSNDLVQFRLLASGKPMQPVLFS